MNWKKVSPADFGEEEKLLRIETKRGNIIHETGIVDEECEMWHADHFTAKETTDRYLGNIKQHKSVYFVPVAEILF